MLQEIRLYNDDLVLWEPAGNRREWTAVGISYRMLEVFTQEQETDAQQGRWTVIHRS